MTNPNDLIRRGDVLNRLSIFNPDAMASIRALPAVTDPQIATLQATNARLVALLKDMRQIIERSDHWWMDAPDRGGFDTQAIDALLNELETTK